MQPQRTADGAPAPPSPDSTLVAAQGVPPRSARRATARRASARRATARQRTDDLEARILEYVKDQPYVTTGDIAKELNADRGTIAAGLSHLVRAGKITKHDAAT
jgi:predicted HTH transcriptional regulator